jgi:hypothetical protein
VVAAVAGLVGQVGPVVLGLGGLRLSVSGQRLVLSEHMLAVE